MKKIAVTVCSVGHLAQAKGLGDSLLKYNPGYQLVIGLVDKLDGKIPRAYHHPYELTEAHDLDIPQFGEMAERYTLLELSCALKYFFVDDCIKKYNPDKIIFFDSDMLVFDSLELIEKKLDEFSVLITPHITSSYPDDGKRPVEKEMLKNGIYNAGFFALKTDKAGIEFLNWFKTRMTDQCYINPKEAMNADQSWFNFIPVYFGKYGLLTHPGCNIAYWNLHERAVSKQAGKYFVNGEPLVFFHYSGYSLKQPDLISRHQDRFDMRENPAINELFDIYRENLIQNGHEEMLKIPCYYQKSSGLLTKLGLKK